MRTYWSALLIMVFCFCTPLAKGQKWVYKLREPLKKTSQRPPVLFILHGYGSNEEDLFDLAQTLDERLTVLSLRAPIELAQGSYCWYTLGRDQNNTLTYNYEEARSAKKQVMAFIQSLCQSMQLDSAQVFLMGFSQGAMMSYDLALSYPGKIKGVLALSGRLIEESKPKSIAPALLNTGFFIAHGSEDERIPPAEAEKAVAYLKSKGIKDIEYIVYPMQHVLNGKELIDLRAWLSKHLKKPAEAAK
ncbi:MAG: prolyl oligopeptidase family serine peptidase [Bacteroidia bacterium]|nr:prolyl oligopeptidase family serine peptidase [Bacteroidia bacterium]